MEELPENVRNTLSEEEQKKWMEAFNSAYEQYKDEEKAFKVAWASVKKDEEKKENSGEEPARVRALNVSLLDTEQQKLDGGVLIKDVILLAHGTWTDSAVRTPLYYPKETLRQYAGNWKSRSVWVRHHGKVPRSVTELVGKVKNPRYDEQSEAIVGDIYLHMRSQASRDCAEMISAGVIDSVSVEHIGEEAFDASNGRVFAKSLAFMGLALVDRGACDVCKIRKRLDSASELESEIRNNEGDRMDEDVMNLIKDLMARVDALEAAIKNIKPPEEKQAQEQKPDEKAMSALEERIKALEQKIVPSGVVASNQVEQTIRIKRKLSDIGVMQ